MAEEKSFGPSKKKLEDARRKGKTLKSSLFTATCTFSASLLSASLLARFVLVRERLLLQYSLLHGSSDLLQSLQIWIRVGLLIGIGSLACGALAGMASELFQIGFHPSFAHLVPKAERMSPATWGSRVGRAVREDLPLQLLRAIVLIWFLMHSLTGLAQQVPARIDIEANVQGVQLGAVAFRFAWKIMALLLVFSAGEFLIKRRCFYRELSMSHDELRREHRESEGDPHIRGRRRSLHEALVFQEMAERVRRSKVIVVERE